MPYPKLSWETGENKKSNKMPSFSWENEQPKETPRHIPVTLSRIPGQQVSDEQAKAIEAQALATMPKSRRGYTEPEQMEMIRKEYGGDKPVGTGQSFMAGAASGMSLNAVGYKPDEFAEKYPEHKTAYTVGNIAGQFMPFGVAYKGAKAAVTGANKLVPALSKTLPKIAATGALAGAPVGAVQSAIAGDDAKTVAKNALLYGALGAAGDVAIEGIAAPIVKRLWQSYKGTAPVITDTIEREVAKEIGVNWDDMNETQRAAIRKIVQSMQPEAAQSGRMLDAGQNFTMQEPYVAKTTIESPRVYDKNAFVGENKTRAQIKEEIKKQKYSLEKPILPPVTPLKKDQLLLPPVKNEGPGFTFKDVPAGFKQTIEVPRVYDKNAFTGVNNKIAPALNSALKNGDTVEFAIPQQGKRSIIKTGQIVGMADDRVVIASGKDRIIKPIDEVKKPLEPLKPPELPKKEILTNKIDPSTIDTKSHIAFKKSKKSIGEKLSELYRATITNQANIDKMSKGLKTDANLNPAIMATNAKKAAGTAAYIVDDGLVNMGGTKISDPLRKVLEVPEELVESFQDLLYHRHNIARMKAGKPIFGKDMPFEESIRRIGEYKKANPQLIEAADKLDKWWQSFGDEWLVKSGLVSSDLMSRLKQMYPHYVPTFRETVGQANARNLGRSVSPTKAVKTAQGSDMKLVSLYQSIPAQIDKVVKATRQNEIYQGILDAVRKDPAKMKPWAELTEAAMREEQDINRRIMNDGLDAIANNFEQALKADPIKGYSLTVMENGKPVSLKINEGLYKDLMEFKKFPQSELDKSAEFVRKWATNPFKAMVTGYNPFFAARNIFRDVPTAYIQGTENNPIKFAKNLFQATKEMKSNSPTYQEYKALGGQGSNFFNVEQGLKPPGLLRRVGDKIAAFNNLTETAPRFGEYLGTLKREGNTYAGKMQGLKNAAEVTTDFARHGDAVKAADAFIPYLNPAFQGIDKFQRSMRIPANIAKAIGTITIPTVGLYAVNQMVAKKEYDQLDNRTKDTYYVIPTGTGEFIKVPKTREAGVLFGALFERLARAAEGQDGSFEGFGNTVANNFFVQNPVSQHVLAPLTWNLPRNKDFANRTIVPQSMLYDKRSPRYQYDEKTSEIAKKIGDTFNLSPKQIDYLIRSYTGVIGNILQPATTKGASTVDVLSRQFVTDPLYSNEVLNKFYNRLDELQRAATDKNLVNKLPSKLVTPEEKEKNSLLKVSNEISKLQKQKMEAQGKGDMPTVDKLQQQILDIAQGALQK